MKGILTDCHTGEYQEIDIDYETVDIEGIKIFTLINGVTGYEGFYIDSEYNHLENLRDNGWTACVGTDGVWDKLFIPGEEMKIALEPYLKNDKAKSTDG